MLLSRRAIAPSLSLTETNGRHYDYQSFIRLIQFWRDWLAGHDVAVGDRVMVVADISTEALALTLACFEAGLVVAAAQQKDFYRIPRFAHLDIKAVFAPASLIAQIERDGGFPAYLIVMPEDVDYASVPFDPVGEIVAQPDSFAALASTSGTTGEPKTVLHTHRTMAVAAATAMDLFYQPDDRISFYMNMNHLGAITVFTLPVIFCGCQLFLAINTGKPVFKTIRENRANKMMMFPWMWHQLLELHRESGDTAPLMEHVDLIITGGSLLSSEFLTNLMRQGVKTVHSVFGMTEAPPPMMVSTFHLSEFDRRAYDSACLFRRLGEPVGGWEVEVRGTVVRVKGDSIGYDKDGKSLAESDGFMTTQDTAEVIDGRLYSRGRISNLKRNGQTVFLSDLEVPISLMLFGNYEPVGGTAFLLMAAHNEATAVTTIVLAIDRSYYRRNGLDCTTVSLEDLNRHLSTVLSPEHTIDHLVFEDEFPNNDLKTDRAVLRKKYAHLFT